MTMRDETQQVLDAVDVEDLSERLSGRNSALMKSKPQTADDDGLTQYIWRMCRFHSGKDPSMPVTAHWWLQGWLDDHGIDASVSGATDEAGDEITEALEAVVDEILLEKGLSLTGAAERWKGLAY